MRPIIMMSKEVNVILPDSYLRALDQLVETGIYMDREEAIMEALRQLCYYHKIEPFTDKSFKPKKFQE